MLGSGEYFPTTASHFHSNFLGYFQSSTFLLYALLEFWLVTEKTPPLLCVNQGESKSETVK